MEGLDPEEVRRQFLAYRKPKSLEEDLERRAAEQARKEQATKAAGGVACQDTSPEKIDGENIDS